MTRAQLGIAVMICTTMSFAVQDGLSRYLAETYNTPMVVAFRYWVFAAYVLILAARRPEGFRAAVHSARMPVHILRAVLLVIEIGIMIWAYTMIGLIETHAVFAACPLLIVALSGPMLGERMSLQRLIALGVGMLGVLVILRPGLDGFTPLSLLALAGMIGFAGRDLASRAAPAGLGTAILGFYGFLAIINAGAMNAIWSVTTFVRPDGHASLYLTGAVLAGICAYASLMKAMRTGEVSAVTPFRYSRLLFGIALGVVIFGESLTPAMLAGSALIVCSGLFILWRGKRAS